MGTILTIILIIVGYFLFCFTRDSIADTNKVVKEGGIYNKYRTLIDHFVYGSNMKIIKQTNKYMCIVKNNSANTIIFHFQHAFDKINITFEVKSVFIGNHKLEWDFPETMPQIDMIKHIETRMEQYMNNVNSKFE